MIKRSLILVVFTIITLISVILIFDVKTNYDMTIYLPKDSNTSQGLEILNDEFGTHTMIEVMVDDVTLAQGVEIKHMLYSIDHIEQIVYIDDYVDITTTPINYIPSELLDQFYVDQHIKLTVVLDLDTYSTDVDQVVSQIDAKLSDYQIALRGESLFEMANRNLASNEILKVMLVIIPIVIALLLITSKSWFDPIIAIISLGVAVILNLGTNAFLPNISFITKTMALALQLALSIDYTLFYLHRYHELRETMSKEDAVKQALKKTFPAITASALTTFAGFLALLFMQYKIGYDIGIVLSKGIILSYLTVLALIPTITYLFDKLLLKGQHKSILKAPKGLLRIIVKLRIPLVILMIIFIGGGFYLQSQTSYTYGTNQSLDETSRVAKDLSHISTYFDQYQQLVILVPNDQIAQEVSLTDALLLNEHVKSVQTLVTIVDPQIPRAYLDSQLVSQYVGSSYTRIIIETDILSENEQMYQFSDDINQLVHTYYNDYYLVGFATTASEIRDIVTSDQLKIMLISIVSIFIILAVTFKNPIIPIFLILIIESAIAVNMGLLYLFDIKTIFIGYLVVMSIQLGATIDYAVLLTTRYLEDRKTLKAFDALNESYHKTLMTMMVSAIILSAAGFVETLFSNISSIQEIGLLLGKGTLISLLFTVFFVPLILLIFDKFIQKTMFKKASK